MVIGPFLLYSQAQASHLPVGQAYAQQHANTSPGQLSQKSRSPLRNFLAASCCVPSPGESESPRSYCHSEVEKDYICINSGWKIKANIELRKGHARQEP